MKRITAPGEMQRTALAWKRAAQKVGFVPTLGYLHEGHLSLIRRARADTDIVVVSVFVNPTQFGPGEDYERYPRDLERDARLCEEAGVDVLFCPEAGDMYPRGWSVYVDEGRMSLGLCGKWRPGHFRGVLTVVAQLFHLVLPDVAFFGQKDAQQARLIRQMVRDLHFPVTIEVLPIVREASGLALSSRNQYLSPEDRLQAAGLYRSLVFAEALVRDGTRETAILRERVRGEILRALAPVDIEYVETVDAETLEPVERVDRPTLLAVAVRFRGVRLIDNVLLVSGSL